VAARADAPRLRRHLGANWMERSSDSTMWERIEEIDDGELWERIRR
jgi:hypothetical protein